MTSYLEQKAKESELFKLSERFADKYNFLKRKEKEYVHNYHVYWDYKNDIGLMYHVNFFPFGDRHAVETVSLAGENGSTHITFPQELKKEAFYIRHTTQNPYASRDYFLSYRDNKNQCFRALCHAFNDMIKGQRDIYTNVLKTDYSQMDGFLSSLFEHYASLKVHS